ncbi:glycoside hydrolase family 10 protein [Haloplasma contractile]|uniref:BCR protein n=1 Tax=Haloplasma contractile SSD-17B TaxID=1033810 RepID=U2DZM1_9MOLU|nr:family 10 glycosylhydrolase [Haloplasma contractile]ERJ13647.1 putative BCR protein [Haloplasma contractile SSD-17B]
MNLNLKHSFKKMFLLLIFVGLISISIPTLAASSTFNINVGDDCTSGDACSIELSSLFDVDPDVETLSLPAMFTSDFEKDLVNIDDAYGVTVVVERGHIVAVYDGANGKYNFSPEWMDERTSLDPAEYASNIEIPKHGFVLVIPSSATATRDWALKNMRTPGTKVDLDGYTLPANEDANYLKQISDENGNKLAIDFVDGQSSKDDFVYLYTTDFNLGSTADSKAEGVAIVINSDGIVESVYEGQDAIDVKVPDYGYVLYTNGTLEQSLKNIAILGTTIALDGVMIPEVKTVTNGNELIKIDYIDPVKYTETKDSRGYPTDIAVDFVAKNDNIVIYTPEYHYNSTKRDINFVEYTVEITNGIHTVTDKSTDGDTYIPLKGYVLSIPVDHPYADVLNVDDVLDQVGLENIKTFNYAVENRENGARIVLDRVNGVRNAPMTVYYDTSWGEYTGTNQFGTEMVVTLNTDTYEFEVVDFREFGEGGQKGIIIPENSFVLSTFGHPYRDLLFEGVRFNSGDIVELVGLEFIELEKSVEATYDYLNPTPEENEVGAPFPGVRGAGQLNVYTDEWGAETGVNEWGFEAAVDANGKVIEVGVKVSSIPEGGFVVSEHISGSGFVKGKIKLGSSVILDEENQTITVSTTADSYIEGVKSDVEYSEILIQNVENKLYDVDIDGAKQDLSEVKSYIDDLSTLADDVKTISDEKQRLVKLVEFKNKLTQADALINSIYYKTLESNVVEARSIWHRPTEKSLEEIQATFDDFEKNNMNLIFVETMWNGYSMFPSEHVDFHKDFTDADYGEYGKDYLAAFIAEGHKRGIEVHAWMEIFFVGYEGFKESNILSDHPEWIIHNYDFNAEEEESALYNVQRNEGGPYIFIDPANPEVHDFLITYYEELVSDYDVDGFQVDYIRYPVSLRDNITGFSDYAIDKFKEEYGYAEGDNIYELLDPKTPGSDQVYNDWNEFKVNNVTNFVEKTKDAIKEIDSDLILSTAIFASTSDAKDRKAQDWPTWVNNGWIDVTAPMAYYPKASTVEDKIKDMVTYVGGITYNYAGIAPTYMGLSPESNAYQIIAARNGEALGSAIFASQNLLGLDQISYVYTNGTHRKAAVLPHAEVNVVLEAMFADILDKADRIYIPSEKMTEVDKTALSTEFDVLKQMPHETAEDVANLINSVNELINNIGDYGSGYADNRIEDDLIYLIEVLDVKVSRLMIDSGDWDPETERVRPNPLGEEGTNDDDNDDEIINDDENTDDHLEENDSKVLLYASIAAATVVVVAGGLFIRLRVRA